jgi:transcription initiation factor TFIIA small subunit
MCGDCSMKFITNGTQVAHFASNIINEDNIIHPINSSAVLTHRPVISMSGTANGITNQHYRERTALGSSLMETLDGLVEEKRITPGLAIMILSKFDVAVAQVLANDVKTTFKAKAHLHNYNHVEDVLSMNVSGKITLQHDTQDIEELQVTKMRIVAMRAHDAHNPSQIAGT